MAEPDAAARAAVTRHDGIAVSGDDVSQVEGSVPGSPELVGWFRYHPGEDRWEWSPQVYRMYGYEPGTIEPTTEVVLSHPHPEDVDAVTSLIEDLRRRGRAFSARHRIVDVSRQVHEVVVVGDQVRVEEGEVGGIHGVYIDLTASARERDILVTEAVAEIAASRAAIEQAKGMMMVVYGIDADRAFDVLRWRSQQTNTKLRALAEQVAADFVGLSVSQPFPQREAYDRLLLTADRRTSDD
ncbi:PAS and ANTAR domain-containing protein [Mycobacterium sp. MYCO198283]|uniref:PAS and ANTAR domain-containing protein n=1 Tax=Mycobacterium sp. MYCO198283 TaxID=2883505 RepID=UPI001E5EFBDC|nr:PAS and ANTAR domain-containing protein [Mycobacterium sp. MYCO198283]MCG5434319.1 PAS and ANTAR domain-containing protein [Mycobacterium sp. MYCO198283]